MAPFVRIGVLSGLLSIGGSIGCQRGRSQASPDQVVPVPSAVPAAPAVASSASALAPLGGRWLEPLALDGGDTAFVAVPLGARAPRPVIVAIHGAGDRPEWACGGWRLACSAHAFVVCPRGSAVDAQRFAWPSARAIALATERALRALDARYGVYVAPGPAMYVGFSQGAILARDALLAVPGRFRTAVLAEGGYELLASAKFSADFVSAGGARVMIVCGGPGCFSRNERAKSVLSRAGLDVHVAGDPRSGHNLNERMQVALRAAWPALVRDDPAWRDFSP